MLFLPVSLSLVILVRDGDDAEPIEATLRTGAALLSKWVAAHELIVVSRAADGAATSLIGRLTSEGSLPSLRAYFSRREVDTATAALVGLENATGDFVAVIDPLRDAIGFLPHMLQRTNDGADIVLATLRCTARAPASAGAARAHETASPLERYRKRARALADRVSDAVCTALYDWNEAALQGEVPSYRLLSRRVVSFIQQHPFPATTYRNSAAAGSFPTVRLEYSGAASIPGPRRVVGSLARRQRLVVEQARERLLSRLGVDTGLCDYVARDQTLYARKHPAIGGGHFSLQRERVAIRAHHSLATNPTLTRLNGRTLVNVRLLCQESPRDGAASVTNGVVRTRNLMFDWTGAAGVSHARETTQLPSNWPESARDRGLEDKRWIAHEGRLWFTATCSQMPYAQNRYSIVLGRMNEALDAVEHLVEMRYPAAAESEKNWLCWFLDGQLLAVYGYHPLTLLAIDADSGAAQVVQQHRTDVWMKRFRGSAGPVTIPERAGCWLVLVHEVEYQRTRRIYLHRWVEFHPKLGVLACSPPFVFDHVGTEFAAGLLDNADGSLTITYGVEDREARWLLVDRAKVLASLRATSPRGSCVGDRAAPPDPGIRDGWALARPF